MDPTQNPDLSLGVEFFMHAVPNPRETKAQGRPIYEDKEYIRIRFPADNKRELVASAHEKHYNPHAKEQMTYAERFKPAYDAFKSDGDLEGVHGTPLVELTILTAAKRAELVAQNIKTVEQLAGLPDNAIKKLGMGTRDLVDSAKTYLERAANLSDTAALHARIAELEAAMAGNDDALPPAGDQFEGFSEDDLKNMIVDAGHELPKGKLTRDRLVRSLQSIADAKEKAA
ncbi:hypothetical protein J7363_04700 [Phaeobacter italicus]|uniref:hypothetical protein n=1 Tax=Phaeobacter italicus TaxID=481446 RepID=UPI001ADBE727|nr:hypothetical protein [Phaeobacter italicus]MBO9441380.1 hypothetical protein [Phaeobacter italicus]